MGIQPSVPARWQVLHLVKQGNRPDEYEDAAAANIRTGRFAVADGASESSFAGLWARLLTTGFVQSSDAPVTEPGWLADLQQQWASAVDEIPLPWYAEDKREAGAYSTFCALALLPGAADEESRWLGFAIGDSCLFQLREETLLCSFPVAESAGFDNHPPLLNARREAGAQLQQLGQQMQGTWQSGDRFLLMTDALAQWFLQQVESGAGPWRQLDDLLAAPEGEAAFTAWIQELRGTGLRNDDITLLSVEL
jgi:hypothetical protein